MSTLATNTEEHAAGLDLVAYAREHRYRLRNLHDGYPVPPARRIKPKGETPAAQAGYIGEEDRMDAIVGFLGYVADEGEPGMLGIYLHHKNGIGVNRSSARIKAMGGRVDQVGDTEIAGSVPAEAIEEALKLIKVSKLKPGRPGGNPDLRRSSQAQKDLSGLESHERGSEVL